MGDANQGIVHIIGPELGLTQPGMTIVCGDSHTSTHGAFGALAFGIGTSEVEHVLATQTLPQQRPRTMAVNVEGTLPPGVSSKDLILAIIGTIGTGGGMGHVIEYRGAAIRGLTMEGRMTVCNMSIEAGARAGMIAPDDVTFEYLEGRRYSPSGSDWATAVEEWRSLATDPGATFDRDVGIDAASLTPFVSWGTNPAQVVPIGATVPSPDSFGAAAGPGGRGAGPGLHGASELEPRCATFPSTRCSSVRAPTAGSRTCGRPPTSCGTAGWRPRFGPWSFPDPDRSRPRPSPRVWTGSSRPPASNGETRGAQCAWP